MVRQYHQHERTWRHEVLDGGMRGVSRCAVMDAAGVGARTKMKTTIGFLAVSVGLLVIASRGRAMTIVREGKAEAVIVIPEGSKAAGAADLQKYVEKVSGAAGNRHRG